MKNNKVWLSARRYGNLYYLNTEKQQANNVVNSNVKEIDLWHYRMGHLNENDLKGMAIKGTLRM